MRINATLLATITVIICLNCPKNGFAEATQKGSIVWTAGYVSGIGVASAKPSGTKALDKLNAIRAAEIIAQRSLLQTIKGVKITSNTTVANMFLEEDSIISRVEGVVKGAETYDAKVEWEEGAPVATVEMRICLAGETSSCKGPGLASALNLDQIQLPPNAPDESVAPSTFIETQEETPVVATGRAPLEYDSSRKVTGLVLNLEGRHFEREMLPIIATRTDNQLYSVYSVKKVKPSVVRTFGIVRYADRIDQIPTIVDLGDNLLIIPALEITKDNTIVIASEHANILRQTLMNGNNYLSDAKVAISSR